MSRNPSIEQHTPSLLPELGEPGMQASLQAQCRDLTARLLAAPQVYLVGDPQQLPATVISPRATAHGYNVSLFRRLQANGFPVQVGEGLVPCVRAHVCTCLPLRRSPHSCNCLTACSQQWMQASAESVERRIIESVPRQVLNHQYRMHPDIAAFPAAEFYENALLNGEAVKAGTTRAWHDHPVGASSLLRLRY